VTPQLIADICAQTGSSVSAFRVLFPDAEALYDAMAHELLTECTERLEAATADLRASGDAERDIRMLAIVIVLAAPLEYSGLVLRAGRRLSALQAGSAASGTVVADRDFRRALTRSIVTALERIGREFAWEESIAMRVLVDTYENSFEAWLLEGGRESAFVSSRYCQSTLPALLLNMTRMV
jgi:AcrR family transcriptional regulator